MYKFIVAMLIGGATLTSCMPPQTLQPESGAIWPTVEFDASEAAYILNSGSGIVSGQSFLRQRGGSIVTCAGYEVLLSPVTEYTVASFTFRYGVLPLTGIVEFVPFFSSGSLPHFIHPPEYLRYKRVAMCDADGRFTFKGVPAGSYFIESTVRWEVAGRNITNIEGGVMATQVYITDNQELELILAR